MDMKKRKKIVAYAGVLALWLLSVCRGEYHKEYLVFVGAFTVTSLGVYLIKRTSVKYTFLLAITAATSIFDIDYLVMTAPVILLLLAYEGIRSYLAKGNKEQKNTADMFITISNVALFLQAICIIARAVYDKTFYSYYFIENLKIWALLFGVFILLLFKTYKVKKTDMKKESLNHFKMIYFSLALETILLLINYTTNGDYTGTQSSQLNFTFIFWMIVILVAREDPFIKRFLNKAK